LTFPHPALGIEPGSHWGGGSA